MTPVRLLFLPLTAGLLLAAASPAGAALVGPGTTSGARVQSRLADHHRVTLPDAVTAAASRAGDGGRWLFLAGGDRGRLATLARRHGGRFDATIGMLSVPTREARAVASRLGDRMHSAGPDLIGRRLSSLDSPGGIVSPWSRDAAATPSLSPAPGALAPIGIVDDPVDKTVAELTNAEVINGVNPVDPHGTMVASVAAAPYDGTGVVGVAPGAKVFSWGSNLSCGDVSTGIIQVVRRGARVVNVSLGFDEMCGPLETAVQYAYAHGATVVSASGNDADHGNPLSFPASYEHVITAAAVTSAYTVASFSNYDDYVDVAAPGVGIPVDNPLRFDTKDGVADGLSKADGTSFASPYVAGGISWILGARPELDASQVAAVLRASTRDLEQPGWDPYTGYGLLQVSAAMAAPAPPKDFGEPNDSPTYVRPVGKGTFGKPAIWSGGGKVTIQATGDSADDDIDAYRVRVPPRARLKVQLMPSSGSADLFAFDQSVKSFLRATPIDASTRSGSRTDTIWVRNTGRTGRFAFIVVNTTGADDTRGLSEYRLSVRRD
ncbi:MAG: S8 family serine peptidase [Patulibacter minatonensis]